VNVVISLLEHAENAQLDLNNESLLAESAGLQFISFPIPDRGVPASSNAALAMLRNLAQVLEEGKRVAVHCRQGIGRSGLIAAGALVAAGSSPEEALRVVSLARGLTIPETPEQRRWVEQLPVGQLALARTNLLQAP